MRHVMDLPKHTAWDNTAILQMSVCLQEWTVPKLKQSLRSVWCAKWGSPPQEVCFPQVWSHLMLTTLSVHACVSILRISSCGYTQAIPPPSECVGRKSVSKSASGTWRWMAAWEQISCSCGYLVLTVHTGRFFHWPWAYQHTASLLREALSPSLSAANVKDGWQ